MLECPVRAALEGGQIRRVLAVRASRLGDLLMTTPTIRAFKEAYPDVELSLLTNPYSAELVHANRDIDKVLIFEGRERDLRGSKGTKLAAELRGKYDLVLALRPRRELAHFAERAAIPHVFPTGSQSEERGVHVVQQCFDRIAPLGLRGVPGPLCLDFDADEIEERLRDLALPERFVHLHPGCDETLRWKLRAGVKRRIWPTDNWITLIRSLHSDLGLTTVLSSGSEIEGRWTERIIGAVPDIPVQRVHRLPLRSLASLTKRALACVTVDTGPLHIATATGTPLIGLYGPSPVSFTGPWSPAGSARALQRDLPCMPCQGRSVRCPRNVCMEELRPAMVVAELRDLLAKTQE